MVQILPAVLATNPQEYKSDIEKLNSSASLHEGWVHVDFMDEKFVPNKSIDPKTVKKYKTRLKKEAHLMVENPKDWIEGLVEAGFERVVIHFESNEVLDSVILARSHGLEVGIAVKEETPIESLGTLAPKIDMVLVMSVNPGFQGQPFLESAFERVKKIKNLGWNVKIAVDGAIKEENAKKLVEAGANQLDVGSFLMKNNIDENLEKLWESINA